MLTLRPRCAATATVFVMALAPVALAAGSAGAASAAKTYQNCTELNKVYPHGVGKPGARDHVSASSKPVTNFTVSTRLYNANAKSDRDKDSIACEKR